MRVAEFRIYGLRTFKFFSVSGPISFRDWHGLGLAEVGHSCLYGLGLGLGLGFRVQYRV